MVGVCAVDSGFKLVNENVAIGENLAREGNCLSTICHDGDIVVLHGGGCGDVVALGVDLCEFF